MNQLLREPLVHFLLIALGILFVDQVLLPEVDPEKLIVVDEARIAELSNQFQEDRGRLPTERELDQLLTTWLQNEVMYREAKRLGLDQGDEMFRNRLVLKIRNMVFSSIVVDEPTDEVLRAWFEENRARYDKPRRFDFEQLLPELEEGARENAARDLAARFGDEAPPPDYRRLVRRYGGRPEGNIRSVFGDAFADALLDAPVGEWTAAPTEDGWRLGRIVAVGEAEPARFEDVRFRVKNDWTYAAQQRAVFEEISAIRDRYEIRIQFGEAA